MHKEGFLRRLGVVRPRIFISYRRKDSGGYAALLLAALRERYGGRSLFLDHESIAGGDEFADELESALSEAEVVLAVIGPDWLGVEEAGQRRLDDPDDWVRRELMTSLERDDVRVIPVLVGNAELPAEEDLPEDLRPLLGRQVQSVRPDRFDDDAKALMRSIGGWRARWLGIPFYAWAAGLAALVTALIVIAAMWWGQSLGPMTGDFNVAVAEFTEIGADGTARVTSHSEVLSSDVSERIATELTELNAEEGFNFQVRGPSDTGSLKGSTKAERAEAAADLAGAIDADVVVYGALTEEGLVPEFFVQGRANNLSRAEELTGQHDLGSRILGSSVGAGSLTENAKLRKELAARTEALVQFVIGLSYYTGREFDEAKQAFERADIGGWKDSDGKEILHLFKGNAAGNLREFEVAGAEFGKALDMNPEYARAHIGRGSVTFQRSHDGCEPEVVDESGLRDAATSYRAALAATDRPAVSNIDAKASFGLGRVYACLSQALIEDRWEAAAAAFQRVVDEYRSGNESIRDLAVQSYGMLAFISMPTVDDPEPGPALCRAVAFYELAVELVEHPEEQESFVVNHDHAVRRLKEAGHVCP